MQPVVEMIHTTRQLGLYNIQIKSNLLYNKGLISLVQVDKT